MYLAFGHFLFMTFFISLNCLIKSSLGLPPYSPLPDFEQYMHPFLDKVPSILGQVKPAFKLILHTFPPKFCL